MIGIDGPNRFAHGRSERERIACGANDELPRSHQRPYHLIQRVEHLGIRGNVESHLPNVADDTGSGEWGATAGALKAAGYKGY